VIVPLGYEQKLLDRKKPLKPTGPEFSSPKGSVSTFQNTSSIPIFLTEKEKQLS